MSPAATTSPRICFASCLRIVLIPILAMSSWIAAVRAESFTWSNTNGTGSSTWILPANWGGSGTYPNAVDDIAIFNTFPGGSSNRIISVLSGSSLTLGTLSFIGTSGTTITSIPNAATTISFAASGAEGAFLNYEGTNNVTIGSAINLLSDLTIQAGSDPAAPSFASTLVLGAIQGNGHQINIVSGHAPSITTFNGAISGAGTRLVKAGPGSLVFGSAGNNTFSGGLDITVGAVTTTLANVANTGIILGRGIADSGQNHLGIGDIFVANVGTTLAVNTVGAAAGKYATLAGSLLTVENGGQFILNENDYRATFAFILDSGTISGGDLSYARRGEILLNGADFIYNADGSGGSAFVNAPSLILNTGQNTTAMNVTLNGTVMQSGLGLVRKTGANALTFTAGDTGTFVADRFIVESGLGAITLNQSSLDLANGLFFTGTDATFANRLALPSGAVSFGAVDQLSAATPMDVGADVIANLILNGLDQTFSSIAIGNNARLGLWFDAATPSTLTLGDVSGAASATVNSLGSNYVSIYNYGGNPATHLADGTSSAGNVVRLTGSADLSKIWFRGYAPGAVDIGGGVLAPSGFLSTANTSSLWGGNWFDFANWTVDIPDNPGAVVTLSPFSSTVHASLQNQSATVGHIVTNNTGINQNNINTGTLVFDSGVLGTSSTISGTGNLVVRAAVRVNNDLVIAATGSSAVWTNGELQASVAFMGALEGDGDIELRGTGLALGRATPNYTGDITVYSNSRLVFYDGAYGETNAFGTGGTIFMEEGGAISGYTGRIATIDSPVAINGNFTADYVFLTHAGDVELPVDRIITMRGGSAGLSAGVSGFGEDFNLVGAGGLTANVTAGTVSLLSGSNTFGGGLTKTGGGILRTSLHSDLVMGELASGNNYLGSGGIAINAGHIVVENNSYTSDMRGTLSIGSANLYMRFAGSGSTIISGAVNINGNDAYLYFDGGNALIADTALWTTGAARSRVYFTHDLEVNTPFNGAGYVDIYSRAPFGTDSHLSSTMTGGITNVGSLVKEAGYQGTLWLDTPIHLNALSISAGSVILNGDNYILPRTGTATATTLTMLGGALQTTGGASAAAPNTNKFTTLSLTGNAGFYMAEHSALWFNGPSWTDTTLQLSLANDSGIWSHAGDKTAYDTYVYFTGTAGFGGANAWRLNNIAFTGYETGAELVVVDGTTGLWFLAPTGSQLSEWVGPGSALIDTDRLWSNAANWINGVPDSIGRIAAVRDADGLLDSNVIILDQDATIGKLLLESTGGQSFHLTSNGGHTLTFDNGADSAVLNNIGSHAATISANLNLAGDLAINQNSPIAFNLDSHITGAGGITFNGSGTLILGTTDASGTSASDYTGGFRAVGSTAVNANATGSRIIRIASDGAVFGSGSYNGTDAAGSIQSLTIGDGTPGRYYSIGAIDGTPRVIDGSVRIAGNWYYAPLPTSTADSLTIQGAAPSYVTSGTWVLGSANYIPGQNHVLNFNTDIEGPGALQISGYATKVFFNGDNALFTGGVIFGGLSESRQMTLGIGSDTALGTGTLTLAGSVENNTISLVGGDRTVGNELLVKSGAYGVTGGTLTFAHSGTSTLLGALNFVNAGTLTRFTTDHVLTGTGGVTLQNGLLRLEGAHTYTGNTQITLGGTLQVGSGSSLGSGTLSLGYISAYVPTLASWGGSAITLHNPLTFANVNVGFDGSDGELTLAASQVMDLALSHTLTIGGTVVFGDDFAFTGTGGITKRGAGTLVIRSADNDFTGGFKIATGTVSVAAAGNFTMSQYVAGESYLGAGDFAFLSGAGQRTLELVIGGSEAHFGSLALTGYNAANTSAINITDTAGVISGTHVKTYIDGDVNRSITGNSFGYLRAPGDIIKTGAATLSWSAGNLVAPNLDIRAGTLDLGSVNMIRSSTGVNTGNLGAFTLGDAHLLMSGSQTFANTTFNLEGSGTIAFAGPARLTFKNVGAWNGTLDIVNWDGSGVATSVGNGNTQFRFIDNVLSVFDHAMLSSVQFYDASSSVIYAPGAKIVPTNAGQFYEMIPVGVSTIWNGQASGNNWSLGGNWESNIMPNGVGAVATFSTTLNLAGNPVNIDVSGLTLGSLVLENNSGANYSFAGNAIAFEVSDPGGAANLLLQGNNSVSLNNSGLTLNSILVVNTEGTGTLTINAPVSGTQSLIKTGTGILALNSAAGTFSGGAFLLDGELLLGANSSGAPVTSGPLGTGTLTLHGGTLTPSGGARTIGNTYALDGSVTIGGANTLTLSGNGEILTTSTITNTGSAVLSGTLSGTATLIKGGSGELTLAAQNTHTGSVILTGGTLALTAPNAIATSTAVTIDATLTASGSQTLQNITGSGTVIDGDWLTVQSTQSTTFSGVVTGPGALEKTGTAALTLTGSNTYAGTTAVNGGELHLGDGGTTGSILAMTDATKTVTIGATGALILNRADDIELKGAITGSGTLIQRGAGELLLDGVEQKHTGGSVIENGTLKLSNGGAIGTPATQGVTDVVDIHAGAALHLGENGGNYGLVNTLKGSGTLIVDIAETSHPSENYAFSFANSGGTARAAQYGENFHGTVEMRHADYTINAQAEAFLNAGTSSLRTADGSYGVIAGTGGTARRIDGGIDFAGGIFQWEFDAANNPVALLDAASIDISAPTQFRLNVKAVLETNTSGTQGVGSLFSTVVSGADNLLLATSDTPIDGAMNWADLQYSINNGASWNALSTPARQGIGQDGAEVAKGVFNWTAYDATTPGNHELRVGYQLTRLEVFKDATLEVLLDAADPTNSYNIEITDYIHNPADGAAYTGSAGSGNVRYSDLSGAGIRVNVANSYTGTTFISGTTTLVLTNSGALGSETRHTARVSATAADAILDVNGRTAHVGGLLITDGAQIDLNGGVIKIIDNQPGQPGVTSVITGGGTVSGNNALTGSGTLETALGNLVITGSNGGLHAATRIGASATVTLQDVAALGDGAITAGGALVLDGATGTNTNAIDGAGLVSATNAANVILGGVNTAFSGTWAIAGDSALKAINADSLGSGKIEDSGTLILGGAGDYALHAGNTISGTGALVKEDANAITISHSNSFTGKTLVNDGALILTAENAIGSGDAEVTGLLELAFAGEHANNTAGSGTALVSRSTVNVTGSNAIAAWLVTGAASVTEQDNLGAGEVNLDDGALTVSSTAWNFTNALTGDGALIANIAPATGTFAFDASAAHATAFTGTVVMQGGAFQLDATSATAGAGIMNDAMLVLGPGASTLVDSGTYWLGALTFDGGLLKMRMKDATRPEGELTVGDFSAPAGSKVALDNWNKVTAGTPDGTDFFHHDNGTTFEKLVGATGSVNDVGAQFDLHDFDGVAITDATRKQIQENGGISGTATYDYGAQVLDAGTNRGLYLAYMLRELSANSSTNVTLDNAGTADAANTLTAKLTGQGGFVMAGTGVYNIGSASSDYTGTTAITSGTVALHSNNAFGQTARLALDADTGVDLQGKTQTVGSLDNEGALNFNSGTLTISGTNGNSTSNGELDGAGALVIQSSTLTVNGANTTLTASASITSAAALVLDEADGFGSGAITAGAGGKLILDGAAGTNTNAIDGAGFVSATNAANVILGGVNTAFAGTWAIAGDSALKAISADSLGSGKIEDSGTLVLGGAADYALHAGNGISGTGALVKEEANTITISHSNSFTGGSTIDSGTLILGNLAGLGAGAVVNNDGLELAAEGAFENALGGTTTAVTTVSGSGINITGNNADFAGAWNITGSGTMTAQDNLGASGTTTVDIASGGKLALTGMGGDYTFNQALTGAGGLVIANTGELNFGAATGNAFTGTVTLQSNTFDLDAANAVPLANATLEISDDNVTNVTSGTHAVANLALSSGTIQFTLGASGTAAEGIITTGTLFVSGTTVVMVDTGSFNQTLPLLQQDEMLELQLVAATAHEGESFITGSNLVDQNGAQLANATQKDIVQGGVTTASGTYDFAATAGNTGLYLSYELTALDLLAGRTTVLGGDTNLVTGGDELHALVSGSGHLEITATSAIRLNNTNNTYTGETHVTSGTLVVGNSGALGQTSLLAISDTAATDLNGKAQTIGALDNEGAFFLNGGTLTISGTTGNSASSGVLDGAGALVVQSSTLTIDGANATLTASTTINSAATVILDDLQGLGSGAITADGALVFDAATGTSANAIDGAGFVSATNTANVILGGVNTAFAGTWAIAGDSALKAISADSLGSGKIEDSGTLVLGGAADYALLAANEITGTGALVKEDANTITISHSNSYTGKTLVNDGALILTAENAIGSGDAEVTGLLELAFTGTHANNTAGTGTTLVSGNGVNITGNNADFIGAWNITGSGTMTAQDNLGASGTTTVVIASGGNLALVGMGGDYVFNQALTGAGGLVLANTGELNFGAATGNAFTGTVTLQSNTLILDAANAAPLENATLEISDDNVTDVTTGTHAVANLALNSGTIRFTLDASGTAAEGIVATGTLSLSGSTVVAIDTGSFNHTLPILQQDEPRDIELVAATAHEGATFVTGSNLVDQDGAMLTNATQKDIVQAGATTASGTYDFAATASGSGLHLGYKLVALDLLDGQTTVLDNETDFITGGDELHALVSGSGHLEISATSAIRINNADNTYTGETRVTSGTLVVGNSGALGETSLLAISDTAATDLNGKAQTIGSLDNEGTLLFNGGALTISGTTGNSASDGTLSGAGSLVIESGTLAISNANPDLDVTTTIAAGATASLKNVAGLGVTGPITADGALQLDIDDANTGVFANALSGAGLFLKTGGGTVAITTANPGFDGAASVENGRLVLEDLSALNAAPIDVSSGAALEYHAVSGALQNVLSGSGTLAIVNSGSFGIAHDNAIENTEIKTSVVHIDAVRALGPDTATIRADALSQIWIGVDGARLGHTTLDSAVFGFKPNPAAPAAGPSGIMAAPPAPSGFMQATLASLSGSGALIFNADFTDVSGLKTPGETADHLTVAGGSTGAFLVHVEPASLGIPSTDETAIPLIADAAGSAVYQLDVEKIEFGLTEFEFASGATAASQSSLPLDPGSWYLYSTGLSQAADAIIDTAALLAKDWHYSLDALYLRMGDVRSENLRGFGEQDGSSGRAPSGNVWVRSRAYRLNATNPETGRGVRQYAYGATAGGDKAFETETGVNLLGGFLDMGRIERDFGRRSTGSSANVSAGLYGTVLKNNGWHADLVLKADRYRHNLDVTTINGRPVRGHYNTKAYGASLEIGRRLQRADGWWVEPGVQAAIARLSGASYRTTPANAAINVKVDDTTAAQYRALLRFGRRLGDSRWTPYGKVAAVRTAGSGGTITAHDRQFSPGFDGWRVEFGAGASYRINATSQVYLDYEYGKAPLYERPWALNLAYRRFW